jgi:glycopeptide antibiotics resistance protein
MACMLFAVVLAHVSRVFAFTFTMTLGILIYIVVVLPLFLVPLIPTLGLYWYTQHWSVLHIIPFMIKVS